jgi:hypothetical protein
MSQIGGALREFGLDLLQSPYRGVALCRQLLDRLGNTRKLGLGVLPQGAFAHELVARLRDLSGSSREGDLSAPCTILGSCKAALRLALDSFLVLGVLLFLEPLAHLIQALFPSVGTGEPEPSGLTDGVLSEMGGDSLSEGIVFLDDPAGDVECRRRQPREP